LIDWWFGNLARGLLNRVSDIISGMFFVSRISEEGKYDCFRLWVNQNICTYFRWLWTSIVYSLF